MAMNSPEAVSKVMEMIKENSVEYVDFRFTDPRGKWQHTCLLYTSPSPRDS